MTTRRLIGIAGWILFAVASFAIQYEVKIGMNHRGGGAQQEMGSIHVGGAAPDFTLADLAGHPTTLSSYRGHTVVLLDFWATWCPPCRMSMPGLQTMADKLKGRPFEILSVNQGEENDQVRDFIRRKGYSFHVVLDTNQSVAGAYGVKGIPTMVLIDKKGVVRRISVGYSKDEGELQHEVEDLIKE